MVRRQLRTFDDLLRDIAADPVLAERDAEMKPSRDVMHVLVGVRLALGMNQREFARAAGVSPSYISRLESGVANPSIRALASVLRRVGARFEFAAVITTDNGGDRVIAPARSGLEPEPDRQPVPLPGARALHSIAETPADYR